MMKEDLRKGEKGSITVFLTLIFVLIVSLILVMLESAKSAAMRSSALMVLSSATESAMCDFYRPLFDEYGIFALDTGYGENIPDLTLLKETVAYVAESNAGNMKLTDCRVTDTVPLTAENGREFISQAVEAEETEGVEELAKALMDKLGILTEQSEVANILKAKSETEKQLAVLDTCTLGLMSLIDGVTLDLTAAAKGGKVFRTETDFVKRFLVFPVNMVNTGINNPQIFEELTALYVNPVELARGLYETVCDYASETERGNEIGAEIEKSIAKGELQNKQEELLKEYNGHILRMEKQEQKGSDEVAGICLICEQTLGKLTEARSLISSTLPLMETLRRGVEEYEKILISCEATINDEMMSELEASLEQMKGYVGLDSKTNGTDFAGIDNTLAYDINLLSECGVEFLKEFPKGESPESIRLWASFISDLITCFAKFSYESLCFDYSTVPGDSTAELLLDEAGKSITTVFANGWLNLILPDGLTVSEKKLDTLEFSFQDVNADEGITSAESIAGGIISSDSISGTGFDDIEAMSPIGKLTEFVTNGMSTLYEKSLLVMYEQDHFGNYSNQGQQNANVLEYEQEYLLCGNSDDKVNLAGTMAQILLMRLLLSGIYVFTDKELTEQAGTVANTLVGFAGMPFLTILVKAAILLIWALEQAVVETSAVARGKKVPLLTTKDSFCISLAELPTFSRTMIGEKAESFPEGSVSLRYKEYMAVLFLIKGEETIAERSLCLIQENLRYRYDDDFRISNCIIGFTAEAEFESEAVYSVIPESNFRDRISGYSVKVKREGKY